MFVPTVPPWYDGYAPYEQYRRNTPTSAWVRDGANRLNKSSGGYTTVTKPASSRHRIKGAWLARPYARTVVYQPDVGGEMMWWKDPPGPNARQGRSVGDYWSPNASNWSNMLKSSGTFSAELDNLRIRAEVECMLKLNSSDLDAGTALAESRQTLGMLSDATADLSSSVMHASRGNWSAVTRRFGKPKRRGGSSVSERWLEYQYGWLPLMGDIYGLHSELQKGLLKRHQTLSATRKVQSSSSTSLTWSAADIGGTVYFDATLGVTVNLVARVSDPFLAKLSALGLLNPAAVVWERVPWSFVVDWVVPVGNSIRAFTAPIGLEFFTGSRTYRTFVKSRGPWAYQATSTAGRMIKSQPAESGAKGIRIERAVYTAFPSPSLYYRNPFTTTRVANALALIDSNLRRTRR